MREWGTNGSICSQIFNQLIYKQLKNFKQMKTGTVKFYNEFKGFGFIKDEDSSNEYFVHSSGLIDNIRDDDKVTFDLQEGKKGLNAVHVKLA